MSGDGNKTSPETVVTGVTKRGRSNQRRLLPLELYGKGCRPGHVIVAKKAGKREYPLTLYCLTCTKEKDDRREE